MSNSTPFVLDSDREEVEKFQLKAKEEHKLKTYLLPIPFIGNPDAPVLLLNLNPGYHKKDDEYQTTKRFQATARNCLAHLQNDFPFYFLDEKLESPLAGPGHNWWARRTLSKLLSFFEPQVLSGKIFCVEYFPYRSLKFCNIGKILESQLYGFHLVRQSLSNKPIVIVMRSKQLWLEAVPELKNYEHIFIVKNFRNPAITRGNLPEGIFDQVVRVIKSS